MKQFVKKAGQTVAKRYLEHQEDPTEALAKFASELDRDLNAQHLDRIATEANRNIIVELSKEGVQKDSDVDPHFTFPTIKTADVIGLIKQSPTMASATPPEPRETKPGIDDIMPAPEGPDQAQAPAQADDIVDSPSAVMELPNKEVAMRVIKKLKERVDAKKRAYYTLANKLDDAMRSLCKRAERELLNGTPLEVLESLPGGDEEIQKVAKQVHEKGEEVVHDETPFDLDYDHPLVKLAQDVEELKERRADAKAVYEQVQTRLEEAQHEARRLG